MPPAAGEGLPALPTWPSYVAHNWVQKRPTPPVVGLTATKASLVPLGFLPLARASRRSNKLKLLQLVCRFAIVHPLEDHTKLELDEAGLAVLERIPGPIAPLVVIGPYRSGKSFLLNQLMGVNCGE